MQIEKLIEGQEKIIEHFANLEHKRWSKWQKYFFSKCQTKPQSEVGGMDDRYVYLALPKDLYDRWNRQIETPYSELSEQEKQSDKNEVMPYVNWHKQSLRQFIDGLVEWEEGRMVVLREKEDHLPNAYQWLKGKNEAREETISHLKEIRKQLE